MYSLTLGRTYEETERRTRQLEVLQSKYVNMQKLFENQNTTYNFERNSLLGTNIVQDLGTANWGTDDDELIGATSSYNTTEDLKQQQQKLLEGILSFNNFYCSFIYSSTLAH